MEMRNQHIGALSEGYVAPKSFYFISPHLMIKLNQQITALKRLKGE